MFCPKCGSQNPDDGRFCRSCGADLENVSAALSGKIAAPQQLVGKKGKPITMEGAITKFFMGIAFLIVSIALAFSPVGKTWWFWMLIPAFSMIGSGIAQYLQVKNHPKEGVAFAPAPVINTISAPPQNAALPHASTDFVAPPAQSIYDTGDLVAPPPSVTEPTTRHLQLDKEGETMTLPKNNL